MQIFKTSDPAKAMAFAAECIGPQGHEGLDVFFNRDLFLQTGVLATSDKEAARQRGIPVWEAEHLGGSIVCFPGDLSLCLTTWGDSMPSFGPDCMDAVSRLLRERGAKVKQDNNDVLADGKKVASWARATLLSGWVQTVLHFSVNVDLELIRAICTKPMAKIPDALSEYGITAEEIFKEIEPLLEWDDGDHHDVLHRCSGG